MPELATTTLTGTDCVERTSSGYVWDTHRLAYGLRNQDTDGDDVCDYDEGSLRSFCKATVNDIGSFCSLKGSGAPFESITLDQLKTPVGSGQSSDPSFRVTRILAKADHTRGLADACLVVFQARFSEAWHHGIVPGVESDRIDVPAPDAVRGGGNEAFTFARPVACSDHAGELRFVPDGDDIRVLADTKGDGRADLSLILLGHRPEAGRFRAVARRERPAA